ncbi:MAG: outer membrane protein transport protein [Gemmatimonadota bacterium]
MKKWTTGAVLALFISLAWAPGVSATDGHFLHGVGAINSAMGGVGVAGAKDVLGALYHNPAGLMAFEGHHAAISLELFKPDRTLTATAPTQHGLFTGSQASKSDFVPIPAFGWSTEFVEDKLVIGFGGLGVGGFGVDYAQSNSHPLLAPKTMGGFGQVYSNFSLLKVTPALAFAPSEKLWIGLAANIDWASLAVDPFPAASPNGAFYPGATAAASTFGFGFQAGLIYKLTDAMNLGLAYTSQQHFGEFEWNSRNDDPTDPMWGTGRTLNFQMDAPAIIGGGISYQATDKLFVEADAKYYMYSSTEGFEKSGFTQTGAVAGFGWDDIKVLAVGSQFQATDKFALRAGYNYSDNPIPEENSFFNVAAPAVIQHHLTLGFGFEFHEGVELSAAYYRAFESEVSGPMWHPAMGQIPQSDVTSSMFEDSFVMQFSFAHK